MDTCRHLWGDSRFWIPAGFAVLVALYFSPVALPHKIALPVAWLALGTFWLRQPLLALAFLLSALGDLAGSYGNFLLQMGSFALAHVAFVVCFVRRILLSGSPLSKVRMWSVSVICAVLCIVAFSLVVPRVPSPLSWGVGVYAVLILTMLWTASVQRNVWLTVGALLFVFSDFILAWNKFVSPVSSAWLLIMIPYYAAQVSLFIGCTLKRCD